MSDSTAKSRIEVAAKALGSRAGLLYRDRKLLCSEAVLVTLNEAFRGNLTQEQAVALASAFPVGLGGSGCLCGAVSGAALAIGLFLGRTKPGGLGSRRVQAEVAALHTLFRKEFGSTCCRVLTREVKSDPKRHFEQCAGLTEAGAEMAAMTILRKRPDLLHHLDVLVDDPSFGIKKSFLNRLIAAIPW
jgi:C_GCAxxG_C_C family probable redox protein